MSHFNIEISQTANQDIVKFIVNSFLTKASSHEFKHIDETTKSPLAQELFYLPFVKTVFISQNFVAIEKYDIVNWEDVQEEVAELIVDYLNSGKKAIEETQQPKKVPISIYAESTPNPTVMKFIADKRLVSGTFEYKNVEAATNSPLATALFNFPFIKEVFIASNYVSVMKYEIGDWQDITMEIREFIRRFITEGNTIVQEAKDTENVDGNETNADKNTKERTTFEKKIIAIIDEYVKPAVADDGGNIALDSFDPDTKSVKVILQGACSGCPSSTNTLKNGIESILKEMLKGEVHEVVAING